MKNVILFYVLMTILAIVVLTNVNVPAYGADTTIWKRTHHGSQETQIT